MVNKDAHTNIMGIKHVATLWAHFWVEEDAEKQFEKCGCEARGSFGNNSGNNCGPKANILGNQWVPHYGWLSRKSDISTGNNSGDHRFKARPIVGEASSNNIGNV